MRQWTVDAFAAQPFRGNPACVVEPFDAWPSDAWMQALAKENNQAETAFLLRTADANRFGLRWFTPGMEVPLCGHATLASAHVLLTELGLVGTVTFDTRSGPLSVRAEEGLYEMDFPAQPPRGIACPPGFAEALGAEPEEVWVSAYLVAVMRDEAQVRGLAPDLEGLNRVPTDATSGAGNICVAALADAGRPYDVVDRFFGPGCGVPEDPTTGSMHCILSPLFSAKLGRPELAFHQAYPGRGGDLVCVHHGERVLLRGAAVTVVESRLRLQAG